MDLFTILNLSTQEEGLPCLVKSLLCPSITDFAGWFVLSKHLNEVSWVCCLVFVHSGTMGDQDLCLLCVF